MSKCTRVQRACKICLQTVTQKNGLQCQGACQSWVHYGCLNYTPGKIKDIKKCIIRVTCPCPDCKSKLPKEYRTDQPFSCSNQHCPANRPPKCDNMKCPINEGKQQDFSPTNCALGSCGTGCKKNSSPQIRSLQPCVPSPPPPPTTSYSPPDGCIDPNVCRSGCRSEDVPLQVQGDFATRNLKGPPTPNAVQDICNNIGLLTIQLKELLTKMEQFSNQANGGSALSCNCKKKKKLI